MENQSAVFYLHISGLGFDGERRFPELVFIEPSIFFDDDEWDVTVANVAPFVDANEGPVDASMNGNSPVDAHEASFVDANEDPPMNASESLPVAADGDDEGQFFANESPFEDANEGTPPNADEGPPMDASEDANDANEGLNVNANEAPFVDANEDPLVDVYESLLMTAKEGPSVVDGSEGLHVATPSGNSVPPKSNL